MIELTRDYLVDIDERCFALKRRVRGVRKETNEHFVTEKVVGYYPSLKSAVKAARDRCIVDNLTSDTFTLHEALEIIEKLDNEFAQLLPKTIMED